MSQSRINITKIAPDLYKSVSQLERLTTELLLSAGIEEGFSHLLRLRASQINQCAYCVRLHTQDALKLGESHDRISILCAWRETGYFTKEERAALALTEAMTLIADGQVEDVVYHEALSTLTEQQIAAIEWLGVTINAWNRIAISSRYATNP